MYYWFYCIKFEHFSNKMPGCKSGTFFPAWQYTAMGQEAKFRRAIPVADPTRGGWHRDREVVFLVFEKNYCLVQNIKKLTTEQYNFLKALCLQTT